MPTVTGVIHGKTIELDQETGLPEGQRIAVDVRVLGSHRDQAVFRRLDS